MRRSTKVTCAVWAPSGGHADSGQPGRYPPRRGSLDPVEDVHDLLIADGLHDVKVLPVSAVRGDNLGQVREILCDRVAHESNAARTASAELDAITARLRPTAAHREIVLDPAGAQDAAASLVRASGAQAVEDSVRTGLAGPAARLGAA